MSESTFRQALIKEWSSYGPAGAMENSIDSGFPDAWFGCRDDGKISHVELKFVTVNLAKSKSISGHFEKSQLLKYHEMALDGFAHLVALKARDGYWLLPSAWIVISPWERLLDPVMPIRVDTLNGLCWQIRRSQLGSIDAPMFAMFFASRT